MSEDNEFEDLCNRIYRLVEVWKYPLTEEQLFKAVMRQVPKIKTDVVLNAIKHMAENKSLPPGKYILPSEVDLIVHSVSTGPVVESGRIPQAYTVTSLDVTQIPDDIKEEIIDEEVEKRIEKEVEQKLEDLWEIVEKKAHKILSELYFSPDYKEKVEELPAKVLDILAAEDALSGEQIVAMLGLDMNKRADKLALVMIWDEIASKVVRASDLVKEI